MKLTNFTLKHFTLIKFSLLAGALLLPMYFASAQSFADGGDGSGTALGTFLDGVLGFIFGPLLVLFLAIAFVIFAVGVIRYFIAGAEDDKSAAKNLMIWGISGFVLILIVLGLVNILADAIGLEGGIDKSRFPSLTN